MLSVFFSFYSFEFNFLFVLITFSCLVKNMNCMHFVKILRFCLFFYNRNTFLFPCILVLLCLPIDFLMHKFLLYRLTNPVFVFPHSYVCFVGFFVVVVVYIMYMYMYNIYISTLICILHTRSSFFFAYCCVFFFRVFELLARYFS